MESFSPLAGRGADEHYVAAGTLFLHLPHSILHQPEKTINIHSLSMSPLLFRHLVNRLVVWRPHAMIAHQDIEFPKTLHRLFDEFAGGLSRRKLSLHAPALRGTSTFTNKFFSDLFGPKVIKNHARARGSEHLYDGGANPSRAAGNHGHAAFQ